MIVRIKPDYNFGEAWNDGFNPQALYVVYALEWSSLGLNAYIVMAVHGHTEFSEPRPFNIKGFEIVDGDVPDDWQMAYLEEYDAHILSFPEWLNPDFAQKAHDYNIDENDEYFDTFHDYAKKYEAEYAELLKPNQAL